VNPASFGESVENWFDASFLIQKGTAGLSIDDSVIPHRLLLGRTFIYRLLNLP
jgi:hypothetical protein